MKKKIFSNFVDELAARIAIEDNLKYFARAIDRRDWESALNTYHEGATDDHGFLNGPVSPLIEHFKKLHRNMDHAMHLFTNILIEFQSPEKAFVESYIVVNQRFIASQGNDEQDGVGFRVPEGSSGLRYLGMSRYLDVFEKKNDEWRVSSRTLVFGDRIIQKLDESIVFPPSYSVQSRSKDDPIYKVFKENKI